MANFPSFEQFSNIIAEVMTQVRSINPEANELTDEELIVMDFIINGEESLPSGYYFQSGYLYCNDEMIWKAPSDFVPYYPSYES